MFLTTPSMKPIANQGEGSTLKCPRPARFSPWSAILTPDEFHPGRRQAKQQSPLYRQPEGAARLPVLCPHLLCTALALGGGGGGLHHAASSYPLPRNTSICLSILASLLFVVTVWGGRLSGLCLAQGSSWALC